MLWKEPIDSNADGNKDIFLKLFFYNMININQISLPKLT